MDMEPRRTCLCFVLVVVFGRAQASTWEYGNPGSAKHWGLHYPICNQKAQSPIDIPAYEAVPDARLGYFKHSLFSKVPTTMDIKNNGHSLVVSVGSDAYTVDDRRLLPASYKLAQYHFHWGSSAGTPGSEHRLNGHQYFGEMHLVHYNTKYGDIKAAMSKSDGLAVLGFFINAEGRTENAGFGRLLRTLQGKLELKGGKEVLGRPETFSISSILPNNICMYYRYKGSLTTPPCYESVIWSVFQNPIQISASQANKLASSLHSGTSCSSEIISGNYRNPQPLNGRKITEPVGYGCLF